MNIESLVRLVGAANAFPASDAAAAAHRDLFGHVVGSSTSRLEAVVRPGSGEELAAVAQQLHADGRAVLISCNGAGNGAVADHGDKPLTVVDLSRLDRIIDVHPAYAHALVEPGVSFAKLRAHLAREGIPLWVDTDRNSLNSVCGSILARHFGHGPYGDHFGLQCGGEFVLRDGKPVRTGMGAVPGNPAWQLYKYALGPYSDGLFSQSTLGYATKLGLWLMPPPPRFEPFAFRLRNARDIEPLVEALRPLKLANVIPNNVAIVNADWNAAPLGAKPATTGGDAWIAYGGLFGLPDTVDLYLDILRAVAGSIAGARLVTGAGLDDDASRERVALMRGEAREGRLALPSFGADRCLWMSFAAPMEGDLATEMANEARAVLSRSELPLLVEFSMTSLTSRTLLMQVNLPFDPRNRALAGRVGDAAPRLMQRMSDLGFGLVGESYELGAMAHRVLGPSPGEALVTRLNAA